jgi:hypothetical protein
MDAFVQLGFVKAGTNVHNFEPLRLMSFYNLVDNKIIEFASKYPDAYRYMPRRAYDYLRPPPILSELYPKLSGKRNGSWFIDLFMLRPVLEIGSIRLSNEQRTKNFKLTYGYSMEPPHGVRFYYLQDMRYGVRTPQGWGCVLRAADLQQIEASPNKADLIQAVTQKQPIFVEMEEIDDLDTLMEWLVAFKEREEQIPCTILSVDDHKAWGDRIGKLSEIPNSKILTAGTTISSLSTLVSSLKRVSSQWSERLVFGSAYPETQKGDGVSEVISFLLSRSLNASKEDLQRILGGNLLQLLAPRPLFQHTIENKTAVVAEGALGKSALKELARLSHILSTRKVRNLISVDFMVSKSGALIDHNTAIINVASPSSTGASSLALLIERDGTLRISGWKKMFTETLHSRERDMFITLVRASTQSSAPILNSPSHLSRFNEEVLRCLQVSQPREILSALHFNVLTGRADQGKFLLTEEDMRAMDLRQGDTILVFDPESNNWCAGQVETYPNGRAKHILMSEIDANSFGLKSSCVVDLVKYEGKTTSLHSTVFAIHHEERLLSAEDTAYIHLHQDEISKSLHGRVLGKDERFYLNGSDRELYLTLYDSSPSLLSGNLGIIDSSAIDLRPIQYLKEFNVILAINLSRDSEEDRIRLKGRQSIRARLQPLIAKAPEVDQFLSSLDSYVSYAEAAVLFCLVTINHILLNRTNGKMGLALPEKYSIQKGSVIQPFVHFAEDLRNEEVLLSIVYSLIDRARDESAQHGGIDSFRSIAEQMDDFGPELPTLIVLFTDEPLDQDEQSPFIKSISRHQMYTLDAMGMGSQVSETGSKKTLRFLKGQFIPLDFISLSTIEEYLLSSIAKLTFKTH